MERINLWMPLIKSMDSSTGYLAVLSDTTIDRDEEMMSRELLVKLSEIDFLPGFLDHELKVLNKVCRWINKRVIDYEGKSALVAEPQFFKSNPKAVQLMAQMDEGDEVGVSISGIPKTYNDVEIAGKTIRKYTEIEGLEASFCGIQSNRGSYAFKIAKNFNLNVDKSYELLSKPGFETTENEIRYRVREPSKYDKFRSKDITSGVRVILGRINNSDKWEIQAVRFDKTKFTLDEAKKWIKEHPDIKKDYEVSDKMEENNENQDKDIDKKIEELEKDNEKKDEVIKSLTEKLETLTKSFKDDSDKKEEAIKALKKELENPLFKKGLDSNKKDVEIDDNEITMKSLLYKNFGVDKQ